MKPLFTFFALFIIFVPLLHAQDTIEVSSGWNIIGAKSTRAFDNITSEPPGIITSYFYGYQSGVGYEQADTLKEGKGYWVKTSQTGLIISAPVNHPPASPSNPTPSDNDTGVSNSPILDWSCFDPDNDPMTYDVYFGTDNPPASKISSGQNSTFLSWSGLNNSTTYYWNIVAKDSQGDSTVGTVWRFTTSLFVWTCSSPISYEGKTYNTVQIGNQCWFRENLDVGAMIVRTSNQSNNSLLEKYCYNDDTVNCNTYGGLYQWNEAMQYSTAEGVQGICPSGWHVPTLTEFQTLKTAVGNDGNALKEVGQGTGGGVGTNASGFSVLLAGYRYDGGACYYLGEETYSWSSTQYNATNAYYLHLNYYDSNINLNFDYEQNGLSIRCLID
ncbi:MAG: hypothetical protein HYZ33_04970 [Ignavibacteriales bacterium]|nr:hypothetical protein [Ignavibacteriales bacterium]